MGFLSSSIRSAHLRNDTHSDASHTDNLVRKLSRVPTHSGYENASFHDHFDKKKTKAEIPPKKRRKKRDILKTWFHRGHKETPMVEKRPTTAVKVEEESYSVFSHEDVYTAPSLDHLPTEEEPEIKTEEDKSMDDKIITDPFEDPPKYLSFKALFKRKRNQSFVNDFEDIATLKRSKTFRERLFGIKTQREVTPDTSEEQEETVYDVSETLTQRYMSSNYDRLVEDMDAIPFDLTVEQPQSVRSRMSQIFQSFSPVKSPSKVTDKECLETDYSDSDSDSDSDDDTWNPYTTAKRSCLQDTIQPQKNKNKILAAHTKRQNGQSRIVSSIRFGTLRRSVTRIIFGTREPDVNDEVDDDKTKGVMESADDETTTLETSPKSFENSANIFNAKELSSFGTLGSDVYSSTSLMDHTTDKLKQLRVSSSSLSRFSSADTMTTEDNIKSRSQGVGKFDKFADSEKLEKWFNGESSGIDMSGSTKCAGETAETSEALSYASTAFMTPHTSAPQVTQHITECGVTTNTDTTNHHAIPVKLTLEPSEQPTSVTHCSVVDMKATIILNKSYVDGQPTRSDSPEANMGDPAFFESVGELIKTSKKRQREDIRGYPRKHSYLGGVGTVRL